MQKLQSIILVALMLFLSVAPAAARVNTGWDWHLVNNAPKRELHYCAGVAVRYSEEGGTIDVQSVRQGLPTSWALWLTQAVDKINSSDTGWKLTPSNLTFPPCQILISLADISEDTFGGGDATPSDLNGDGKIDLTRIVIDSNLENTSKDSPEGENPADENNDGWSTEAGQATRDPVAVLMHELTHAMRLRHHADSSHTDVGDKDISDPRQPGDHSTDFSEADLAQLREASGTVEQLGSFEIPPGGKNISFEGIEIVVPEYALGMNGGLLDINVYDGSVIPDPLALPEGYLHVFGSGTVYIRTSTPLEKPIKVTIPYTNDEIRGGNSQYIGDINNYVPPPVEESTMKVFKHIARPFGVESEISPHWELVEGSSVDTKGNSVTFETTETGIFGISGMQGKAVNNFSLTDISNLSFETYLIGAGIAAVGALLLIFTRPNKKIVRTKKQTKKKGKKKSSSSRSKK